MNETKRTTHGRLINTHSQTLEWEHSNGFSLMPQIYTHSPTVALRTHTRMRKALSHVRTKAHAFCLFTQPQDVRPVQSCINIWLHICQSADLLIHSNCLAVVLLAEVPIAQSCSMTLHAEMWFSVFFSYQAFSHH